MTKHHRPVLLALPAPRRSATAFVTIGFALLGLTTSAVCGTDSAATAGQRPQAQSATAGGDTAAAAEPCRLTRFASGEVKTVIDGRTFVLEDGREIRLAAIEVAPIAASHSGGARPTQADVVDPNHGHAGEAARRALAELSGGRNVVLKQADPKAPPVDRYERFVAFGFVTDGATERSLQEILLANGHAQLSALVLPRGCLPGLRAHEQAARRASLGLWADPLYSVKHADRPADILAQRGRFAVVEGKVVSVRESGGTIYVNFGLRWSDGFSAFILKRNAARFPAAGLDLKRLEGRRVEVRGYVEQRRGPGIAVDDPEQIAIIEGR